MKPKQPLKPVITGEERERAIKIGRKYVACRCVLPTLPQLAYSVVRVPVIKTISTWSTSLVKRSRGTDAPVGPAS